MESLKEAVYSRELHITELMHIAGCIVAGFAHQLVVDNHSVSFDGFL